MLYEHPSEARPLSIDRGDDAIPSVKGLGAVIPHSANVRTPSGSGGFGVLGIGGGGGNGGHLGVGVAGPGTANYRPVGRNTQVFTPGMKRLTRYQPSAIAPRASTKGDAYDAPNNPSGVSGFFQDIGAGKIQRAFTPSRTIKANFTRVGRVTETVAVGAGAGFLASGLNPLGAVGGGIYGLGKGIQATEVGAPQGRALYQTILPAAGIGAVVYGISAAIAAHAQAVAGAAYVPGAVPATAVYGPAYSAPFVPGAVPAGAVYGPGVLATATPTQAALIAGDFGAPSVAVANITEPAAVASPGIFAGPTLPPTAAGSILGPTPAQIAANAAINNAAATEGGWLASAKTAGGFIGKTAAETAAAGFLMTLRPGQGSSPLSLGYQDPGAQGVQQSGAGFTPAFSGSGGGASPVETSEPVTASLMTPRNILIGGALLTAGLSLYFKRRKRAA